MIAERQGLSTGLPLEMSSGAKLWHGAAMTWELALVELFDDLEARADGEALSARAEDVADLARAEYAAIGLESRLLGSLGEPVALELVGATVTGRLLRVGRGCVAVTRETAPRGTVLVNLRHLLAARTSSSRAVSEESRPLTSRLGLASALRHLVEEEERLLVRLSDGRAVRGEATRVGADFLEVRLDEAAGDTVLLPMRTLVTVEQR